MILLCCRTLGDIGDRETETQVILIEHDIPPNVFSKEVLECLPPDDWKISEENSKGREVCFPSLLLTSRIFVIKFVLSLLILLVVRILMMLFMPVTFLMAILKWEFILLM